MPLLHSYEQLAVSAGLYGLFISANYALTTIILVQLLGMDRLTNAYGMVMLAAGIANFIGPPAAGMLFAPNLLNSFTALAAQVVSVIVYRLHL